VLAGQAGQAVISLDIAIIRLSRAALQLAV
jgi:hypothetical protein